DGIHDPHHLQDRHRVTTSHQRPWYCNDGQILGQGLQGRIVSGPADTVETDVAPSDRGAEPILAQTRQDNDKVTGLQAELGEGAIEPFSKQLGYVFATRKLDENETAVTHLSGDPWKNRIILGQIFEERLTAPKRWHRRGPSELCGSVRLRLRNDRFIISRHVREPDQPLGVVLLTVGQFHQLAAEKIV